MTRILSALTLVSAAGMCFAAEGVGASGAAPDLESGNGSAPASTAKDESVAYNADPAGPLGYLADKVKIKAIHDALGCAGSTRRIFEDLDSATAAIATAAEKTNQFAGLPLLVMEGADFTNARVVVATLGMRIKETGTNAIKAVLVFPQPPVENFIESALDFVTKLIEREATDTQFGPLRTAGSLNELTQALKSIPTDVDGITTSSQSNAIDTSAFDDFWAGFKSEFVKQKPAFDPFIPGKPIVLKALRSASYAKANPATKELESKGYWIKIGQMFVDTLKQATDAEGKNLGINTSVIEGWLADRENVPLTYNDGATPSAAALEL